MAQIIDPNEVGALSGLGYGGEEEEEEEENNAYALYQNVTQASPAFSGNLRLQDVYGTSKLPMYQWVKRIETGQSSYDPSNQFDNEMLEQYKQNMAETGEKSDNPTIASLVKDLAPGVASLGVGAAFSGVMDPFLAGKDTLGGRATSGLKTLLPGSRNRLPGEVARGQVDSVISSGKVKDDFSFLAGEDAQKALKARFAIKDQTDVQKFDTGTGTAKNPEYAYAVKSTDKAAIDQAKNLGEENIATGGETAFGQFGDRLFTKSSAAGFGVGFGTNFALGLITGQDPLKAAKGAAATAAGSTIGSAAFGPIGGFIGGAIGGVLGGRVICNELHRQGLMDRERVVLDYRFTRDYLSPTHVNGYHLWALLAVRQMRRGRLVNFWRHIATHRANEIAYIFGKRDKPDYLGKVYRRIFEPICWTLGLFGKSRDWSVLYNAKEI